MQSDIQSASGSKAMVWTGRVISTLMVLFMLFDAVMKLIKPEAVVKGTVQLGFPEGSIVGIGIALLVCTILYVIPQTCVLGAILLTGYLGGAVASQVRIEAGAVSILFPFLFAVLVWLGYLLAGCESAGDRAIQVLIDAR